MPPGLVLFEPDRPHNFGAALRLAACLGIELHVIEPCGFPLHDRRIRQAALDYVQLLTWRRHPDFASIAAEAGRAGRRFVLLTTHAALPYHGETYRAGDLLVLGRESGGVPGWLHEAAHRCVRIPTT